MFLAASRIPRPRCTSEWRYIYQSAPLHRAPVDPDDRSGRLIRSFVHRVERRIDYLKRDQRRLHPAPSGYSEREGGGGGGGGIDAAPCLRRLFEFLAAGDLISWAVSKDRCVNSSRLFYYNRGVSTIHSTSVLGKTEHEHALMECSLSPITCYEQHKCGQHEENAWHKWRQTGGGHNTSRYWVEITQISK